MTPVPLVHCAMAAMQAESCGRARPGMPLQPTWQAVLRCAGTQHGTQPDLGNTAACKGYGPLSSPCCCVTRLPCAPAGIELDTRHVVLPPRPVPTEALQAQLARVRQQQRELQRRQQELQQEQQTLQQRYRQKLAAHGLSPQVGAAGAAGAVGAARTGHVRSGAAVVHATPLPAAVLLASAHMLATL